MLQGLAAAQHTDRSPSVRYQRFTDELDPETHVPLCDEEEQDDSKETITWQVKRLTFCGFYDIFKHKQSADMQGVALLITLTLLDA